MPGVLGVQGRELRAEDLGLIQGLLAAHRAGGRTRLSEELCHRWDWRNARGRLKDMAARPLLLKLERAGHLRLPPRRRTSTNGFRNRHTPLVAHATAPLCGALRALRPLAVSVVEPGSEDLRLFNCLLRRYHYLGHRNTGGENIRYLVRDRAGRPVGCARFGSAAWQCAARDAWIGWERGTRAANLGWLTNTPRLLGLPWVEGPHWASHLLAGLARRIRADGQADSGHPVQALEPCVDRDRFRGTCYRAATWSCVGQTQGRSRQDRDHPLRVPIKDVYLSALIPGAREALRHVDA